jgi:hypothetical protein
VHREVIIFVDGARTSRAPTDIRSARAPHEPWSQTMRTIALLPLLFIAAACSDGKVSIGSNGSTNGNLQKNPDGSPTGDGTTCEYAGATAKVGDHFPSPDGCNTCTCAAEGVYCTELACASDAGVPDVCTYGGKGYAAGAGFPSTDGCNSCGCEPGGAVVCTQRACASDCSAPNACTDPRPGVPNIQCADGTTAGPTCTSANGSCGWSVTSCHCEPSGGGVSHNAGETWSEACQTCSCSADGRTACTASACTCPPDGTIDCTPPVSAQKADVCGGSYHQWVVQNCPNVHFVQ